MGLYRDETGRLIEIDDKFADARGYEPASPIEVGSAIADEAAQARVDDQSGLGGSVQALGNAVNRGLTLGGTDIVLGETLTPFERQRVLDAAKAHPYLDVGGEILGGVAGALAAPGSALGRTPTGYLGAIAQREVEAGLAQGGIVGTAKAIGAMGAEGAFQGAGQYLGHAALEDKEVTAEGLAGALGTGFAFGAAGGGAVLGVAKGTMAARRMYSRVMDGGKAAQAAESTWTQAAQEAFEADQATARAAQTRLDEIRAAKIEAMRYRNEAKAMAQEERVRAAAYEQPTVEADFEASVPTNVIPREQVVKARAPAYDAEAHIKTNVVERPDLGPEGPTPLDEGIDPSTLRDGPATSVFKRKLPEATPAKAAEAPTDLEAKLAGTKAQLDSGKVLREVNEGAVPGSAVSPQIPPGKAPPHQPGRKMASNSIEDWLSEKAAFDADELSQVKRIEDIKGANELRMRRQETLSEIRYKSTEDLLGPQVAKQEQKLADLIDEYTAAKQDVEALATPDASDVLDDVGDFGPEARVQRVKIVDARQRQALDILDDAHEEALLRAKHAADPQEAGRAIAEAEQLEMLLEGLSKKHMPVTKGGTVRDGLTAGGAWATDIVDQIRKVQRYEKASAELAEELADSAHPVSTAKAEGFRAAEREGERRMYDRAAQIADDAEHYGPQAKTPKERVAYARGRQAEAQAKVDELGLQEKEAGFAKQSADRKVREGDKARKAALREDAKLARAANATGKANGVQDLGGLLEVLDIPGLPKPSDLPIVGPLLGAYLKFRTLKKAMGKAMGRVQATADARVAALANQTRDRIARAVDRSLGVLEKAGKAGTRVVPPVAGILSHRIYDDGGENPPKNASIPKLAAARMREINAYVSTPGAIELDVRRELQGVTDPDIVNAAAAARRSMMEYIQRVMPKVPDQGLLHSTPWEPSPAEAMSFARRLDALGDPAGVYERLAQSQAMMSLEASEVLRDVYPKLFQQAQQRVLERAAEGNLKVPYRTRVQMAVLFKLPALEPSLDPANFAITQSVYERKPSSPAYNPAAPGAAPPAPSAQPSIANPVNISQGMTPVMDRR